MMEHVSLHHFAPTSIKIQKLLLACKACGELPLFNQKEMKKNESAWKSPAAGSLNTVRDVRDAKFELVSTRSSLGHVRRV